MKNILLIIWLFVLPNLLSAQEEKLIFNSIEDAIAVADQRSLILKSAETQILINQENQKTSFDLGKTQFSWQHGQYNSLNRNDNYFSVNQNFAFPTVYVNQNKVAQNIYTSSEMQLEQRKIQLHAEVKKAYTNYLFFQEKVNLFQLLDSNYLELRNMAKMSFEAGNSTALDKMMIETNAMEIKNQLRSSLSDLEISETTLKILLNLDGNTKLELNDTSFSTPEFLLSDNLSVENNSALKGYLNEIKIKESQAKLEQSKLYPDLSLGYFNQSLIGQQTVNNVNQSFGPGDRFQGFSVGIAIPLWARPQIAKVNVAQMQTDISTQNAELFEAQIKGELMKAQSQYLQAQSTIQFYEESGLKQVDLLIENVNKSLESGDINTTEFTQIMNQTIYIKLNYLQALLENKLTIIQIEYLTGIQ